MPLKKLLTSKTSLWLSSGCSSKFKILQASSLVMGLVTKRPRVEDAALLKLLFGSKLRGQPEFFLNEKKHFRCTLEHR